MKISILTLFPEYFESILSTSMLQKAQTRGAIEYCVINIRDFATDKHHITDDRPFGGGAGMVMKIEPIHKALQSLNVSKGQTGTKILLTSAKGPVFTQQTAQEYVDTLDHLVLICGHYEGVDERVAEHLIDAEIRIGDYVLTGGEPAVGVIIDAVTRLLPDALGNHESIQDESHAQPGLLGYPTYTRPAEYNSWEVPTVLLSGDHSAIEKWRKEQQRSDDAT